MAFLSCKNCDWAQDDFWTSSYNPLLSLEREAKEMKNIIQGYKSRRLGFDDYLIEQIPGAKVSGKGISSVDFRLFYAFRLERAAKVIRGMVWPTEDDWEKEKNKICPSCGSSNMTID